MVSGIILILCFLTKFASTQSMLAPMSGRDLSVDNILLLVFTLKFTRGVGDPGTSALAIGLEIEFLPFVEVFIEAALALKCNFF